MTRPLDGGLRIPGALMIFYTVFLIILSASVLRTKIVSFAPACGWYLLRLDSPFCSRSVSVSMFSYWVLLGLGIYDHLSRLIYPVTGPYIRSG